ncbi:hypothetical protein MRB53_040207 [Persea americana]|nr:hypothetical protein MRB53_040207 [Persea americana]
MISVDRQHQGSGDREFYTWKSACLHNLSSHADEFAKAFSDASDSALLTALRLWLCADTHIPIICCGWQHSSIQQTSVMRESSRLRIAAAKRFTVKSISCCVQPCDGNRCVIVKLLST